MADAATMQYQMNLQNLMTQYEQLYTRYMQGDTSVGPQLNQLAEQMGTMSNGAVAAQTPPTGASTAQATPDPNGTPPAGADANTGGANTGGAMDMTGSGNLSDTYGPSAGTPIDPLTGLPLNPGDYENVGTSGPSQIPGPTGPQPGGYNGSSTVMTGPLPTGPYANSQTGQNIGPNGQPYPLDANGNVIPSPGFNPGTGGSTPSPSPGTGPTPLSQNPNWGAGRPGTAAGSPSDNLTPEQLQALQNATAPPPNPWDQAQQSGGIGGGMGGLGGGASGLPGFAPPPGGNAGNFLGSAVQSFQNAQDAANKANAAMYGNIQSGYNQLGSNLAAANSGLAGLYGQRTSDFASGANNVLGNYGNLLNSQTQGYGNIQNNQAQGLANIGQGYTSMLGTALNNLNLLGATEGTDLNQQFQNEAANAQQSLVDRGLNNTTVTDAVQRGIGLDKARALTNLAQGVNAQTNQTLSQFGNPALQFGQQAIAANTGLGTTALQNQNQIAQAGLGAAQNFLPQIAGLQGEALNFGNTAQQQQTQLGQNQLNFMQGVNQTGPDYNTLAQLMMAAGAAGTGYGQNGFANLPNFPGQNPVGPLPGANLSNPNLQTQAQPISGSNPYSVYIQALQQAQRQPAAGSFNMYPTAA